MDARSWRDAPEGDALADALPVDGSDGRHGWLLRMRWIDLLFAHWRVEPDLLEPVVPAPLQLETFDGSAWLGVVPFLMRDTAPRGVPAVPGVSAFAELNVRTYVTYLGRPGVLFLSLDAANRLAVVAARTTAGLPYFHAEMSVEEGTGGWIDYRSSRRGTDGATFGGRYRSLVAPRPAPAGSLAAFLTVRDGLWTVDARGRAWWLAIRHPPWPLEHAEAAIDDVAVAAADGVPVSGPPDDLAFSRRVDVRAWRPVRYRPG